MSALYPPRSLGSGDQWGRTVENEQNRQSAEVETTRALAERLQARVTLLEGAVATLSNTLETTMTTLERVSEIATSTQNIANQNARTIRDLTAEIEEYIA